MRTNNYKKHGFYLIGSICYALWINLGSALDNVQQRLNTPYFKWMVPLTVVLLLAYLYHLSRVVHRFQYTDHFFKTKSYPLRLAAFLFFSLLQVCIAHSLLIFALLSQRRDGMALFLRYFKVDFWVFAVPLLIYCLLLYRFPEITLFRFKRVDRLKKHCNALLKRQQELGQENKRMNILMQQLKGAKNELEKKSGR